MLIMKLFNNPVTPLYGSGIFLSTLFPKIQSFSS